VPARAPADPIPPGEDLGERIDQAPALLSSPSTLLEGQKIEAAVEEPAVVRKLVFDVFSQVAAGAQLVDAEGVEIGEEVRILNLIETTAVGLHGRQVTGTPI
jgi:hypothetical protein